MTGESSSIQYKLDKNVIEFGLIPLSSTQTREIVIFNTGRVPLKFSATCKNFQKWIKITPATANVAGNSQQKIQVTYQTAIPEKIEGKILIDVLNFDTEEVRYHIRDVILFLIT